jgi:KaiC/GvpD/RAD55 family RecA-like ATPase
MTKADSENRVSEAIERHMQGGVIMLQLPAEEHFESSAVSVRELTKRSFEGVYVSFRWPYKNISSMLEQKGADLRKILFVDAAPGDDAGRCVHISGSIGVDELIRAINTSLPRIKSAKKFIFIDSMSAIALRNPLSETMRFFEFLSRTVKRHDTPELLLIFNISKDGTARDFIRDSVIRVDETVEVG